MAAKEIVGHGFWLQWLEREFGWSVDTAANYIEVAQAFGTKFATVANLTIDASALYTLAKPHAPPEAIEFPRTVRANPRR